MLVLRRYEALEGLRWVPVKLLLKIGIQREVIFPHVLQQVICAEDLSYFDKLIIVVISVKEWILLEDDLSHGASSTPNVKAIVIPAVIDQQFRSFVESGGDTDIVLLVGEIEIGEAPVNDPQFFLLIVKHDILRLDVSVHDTMRVTVIESLEKLVHVEPNIVVIKLLEQPMIVQIIDVLKDQARSLAGLILRYIKKLHNVMAAIEVLEDFDLPKDLGMADGFEDLDADLLLIQCVQALKDL